ncbi:hypothetical protein BH753_gp170 [Bacillus phage Shbh1]|uniref:Uncharacterized protein n=1 Tax=Bacillus phage Shbh1 TaxID=1796992 RepID=A0A142F1J5_9CAUD|nr:hypothetical protein BH753_gp170 [Bacillus phage Shbh1]AMQ66652.1 hypothetical protein [Bacillus phage Shbh1]
MDSVKKDCSLVTGLVGDDKFIKITKSLSSGIGTQLNLIQHLSDEHLESEVGLIDTVRTIYVSTNRTFSMLPKFHILVYQVRTPNTPVGTEYQFYYVKIPYPEYQWEELVNKYRDKLLDMGYVL